ncbi:MAG: hypothetical protein EOO73_20265 [Myxococcales bacterium]|nr:MAG: hypothetical protein EOO73_20265 [Myxococcales bacterium]
MLDELPTLELAASAVAVVLVLRAVRLGSGPDDPRLNRRARVESARARDLIGLAILAGAIAYAFGMGRASTWFLVAVGVAIAAQLASFYLRARAQPPAARPPSLHDDPALEIDEEEELYACPQCGHAALVELEDSDRFFAGLQALTPVVAFVCPSCGALSGYVEEPKRVPVGEAHGTRLRQSPSGEDDEALEDPTEHAG